jgi:hypothetical protein
LGRVWRRVLGKVFLTDLLATGRQKTAAGAFGKLFFPKAKHLPKMAFLARILIVFN